MPAAVWSVWRPSRYSAASNEQLPAPPTRAPPAVSALAGVVSSGPEIGRWSGGRGRGSQQTIARTESWLPHGTEGFSGSFSALQNTTARCVFNLIRLWGSLRFPARAKWNGLVLWSVRARARTAVHGAVGSPLGPSGVLTPARRRASSVLRSAVCVRSRGLRSSPLRSAAPRGAVQRTPASRTPPRRTPPRPLSCRPHPLQKSAAPTAIRPSRLPPRALSVPPQTPRPFSGRVPCGPPRESPRGSKAAGRIVRLSR